MSLKVVMFDLDGTLLPMNQDIFVKAYFGGLVKKLLPLGYEGEKLVKTIWYCTDAMINNNGEQSNEKVFWKVFESVYGERVREDMPMFDRYYYEDFDRVKDVCGYNPEAAKTVREIKKMGLRTVLATNPLFPRIATEKRLSWTGLETAEFELYTTYENSSYTKPNPEYYVEILNKIGVLPQEVLMVGNDVSEDMIARNLGANVFLITDNLINKSGEDITKFPNGTFSDLIGYVKELIK